MGYAASFLRQHRPDLCPTIVAHSQAYRAAQQLRRLDHKWSLVTHVVAQLYRQGLYPSQGRVTQYLVDPTALLEPKVTGPGARRSASRAGSASPMSWRTPGRNA